MKERAIWESFNSHDCETIYSCPHCKKKFSSWDIYHQEKNENGTKGYCPECKEELRGLD